MGYMKSDNWDTVPPLLGALQGGNMVRTEVFDPEATKAAGPVFLRPGDHVCSGCGALIDGEEFPGAAWANLLAQQKLQYGHTMCSDCHKAVKG